MVDTPSAQPEIDFDALSRKYASEREKRLRQDASFQYRQMTGEFAGFAVDPFAGPDAAREPVDCETDVLIIGAGYGGLMTGVRLRQAGITNLRVLDKASDFGGTWYWNRYPGVACDVDAYVYMPFLEETGYMPREKYAKGPEIREHCERIAQKYDLYRDSLFRTTATTLVWDEKSSRWIVRTDRGDRIAARFVVGCTGLLSKPKLPGIPGLETFEGVSFHTSRWNYEYTGGDHTGGLTGLAGKRVGVIGTGSTGIQVIPKLAADAGHLYVFQRTPSSIDRRGNMPTDPDWAASLKPGWQDERIHNFTAWTSGRREGEDLINDAWTDILGQPGRSFGGEASTLSPEELQLAEFRKMEKVRQRIDAVIEDPATAEALKPWYNYFCKRPCFSDEYLQTYNRPNVTLVDTEGKGVERITPTGAVVNGKEYPLDCLIYATGFDYMLEYARESGLDITGRNGVSLTEHWSRGARTLYGMQTRGFPNYFLMSLVQAGVSINYIHIADVQTKHIASIISQCIENDIAWVEPTEEAEEAWVSTVMKEGAARRAQTEACTPSYANYEGQARETVELNQSFTGGPLTYVEILEKWRVDGSMPGLEKGR